MNPNAGAFQPPGASSPVQQQQLSRSDPVDAIIPGQMTRQITEALRAVGFTDRDIWDIVNVTGFFNMTNRVASATDMRPNDEYHAQTR